MTFGDTRGPTMGDGATLRKKEHSWMQYRGVGVGTDVREYGNEISILYQGTE